MSTAYAGFSATDAKFAQNGVTSVADIIAPELLVPRLSADNKIGAIKELVDRLHAHGVVADSLSFFQSVLERETLQSTILSGDVAIPHARSRTVNHLGMALGIAPQPLDFPSGDERQAIRLICLIAVPAHEPLSYLSLLSTVAHTFSNTELKNTLLQVDSSKELYHLLSSHPPSNIQ